MYGLLNVEKVVEGEVHGLHGDGFSYWVDVGDFSDVRLFSAEDGF